MDMSARILKSVDTAYFKSKNIKKKNKCSCPQKPVKKMRRNGVNTLKR